MRQEVQKAIEVLNGLNLSTYPYVEIVKQFENVGEVGNVVITLNSGKSIFRARLNENEEHFTSKCQLTYKPQQFNNTCQRASTPNMSMFYGSVVPEELEQGDLNNTRVVPMYEAVPWMRDENSKGKKDITFSRWIVTEEINLIAILEHGNFYDKSSYTKNLMDEFETFLNQHPDGREETIAFKTFLANEFAKEVNKKNDYEYLISAAFTETVVKDGFDGVLYPSMRLGGAGFNVALTPQAADTKLQLVLATECSAYKLNKKTVMDNDTQAEPYPNQTHFEYRKVDDEFHAGEEECLGALGVSSLNELK